MKTRGSTTCFFAIVAFLAAPSFAFSLLYSLSDTERLWGAGEHFLTIAGLIGAVALPAAWLSSHRQRSVATTYLWVVSTVIYLVSALFYSTLAIGLLAWGRLPNTTLISSYLPHAEVLIHAIGIDQWALYFGVAVAMISVSLLTFWLSQRIVACKACRSGFAGSPTSGMRRVIKVEVLLCVTVSIVAALSLLRQIQLGISYASSEPLALFFAPDMTDGAAISDAQTMILPHLAQIGDPNRLSVSKQPIVGASIRHGAPTANVILITVDALRPDHMSAYGYARDTTPFVRQLIDEKYAFAIENARSGCAESVCGLLGLLSGAEPHRLDPKGEMLADSLAAVGYRTFANLSGDHASFYGLGNAFGKFDVYIDGGTGTRNRSNANTGYVNDDFAMLARARLLPPADAARGTFLFFHLMSAHSLAFRHDAFRRWTPTQTLYMPPIDVLTGNRTALVNHYDNGVLQADAVLRELFKILLEKGYLDDRTIGLITADHGEGLGEFGVRTHASTLYEPVVRVPWIWFGRRATPLANVHGLVHADYAPTVRSLVGLSSDRFERVQTRAESGARKTFHFQYPYAAVIQSEGRCTRSKTVVRLDSHEIRHADFACNADDRELQEISQRTPTHQKLRLQFVPYVSRLSSERKE